MSPFNQYSLHACICAWPYLVSFPKTFSKTCLGARLLASGVELYTSMHQYWCMDKKILNLVYSSTPEASSLAPRHVYENVFGNETWEWGHSLVPSKVSKAGDEINGGMAGPAGPRYT